VTSSYHPPKVLPPFYTGSLSFSPSPSPSLISSSSSSLSPSPSSSSSSSSCLTRTGGGYINSLTGLPAGANKFVQLHTITHPYLSEDPTEQQDPTLSASAASESTSASSYGRRIGLGKILNKPGVSRNDARLHKCVDDLIVHLCRCETNEERQLLKMEFTKTIRKYGKATKGNKDKYGGPC
jgi:hypothetical protein